MLSAYKNGSLLSDKSQFWKRKKSYFVYIKNMETYKAHLDTVEAPSVLKGVKDS